VSDVLFPMLDEEAPETPGVVSTWFAEDGATVREGLLIAEVQVSKIAGEIVAPESGTLRHKAEEGEVVAQGSVVATIEAG
jgi:pyruvate/2-oxoglutarate dehydrogenase complex dihydrolipoamide acyltransferase (E2) component